MDFLRRRDLRGALAIVALLGVGFWILQGPWRTPSAPRLSEVLRSLKAGNSAPALDALDAWAGRPGMKSQVRLLRGALLLQEGDARAALLELAPLDPTGEFAPEVLLWRGECLYRVGRFAEAEIDLRQLVALQPDNVDAHRWLGAVYYDLGANEAALAELQRVVELDPRDYRPHWVMGMLYAESAAVDLAHVVQHYRAALALAPPEEARAEIVRNLAKSLIEHNEHREALRELQTVGADALSAALQAECWWVLGDRSRADALLKQARELDPANNRLLQLETRMALADKDPRRAVAAATEALKRDPHDPELRYSLALAYRDLGHPEAYERELVRMKRSRDLMQRLTELNRIAVAEPSNTRVRRQLAETCEALGKSELAQMWRRAAAGTAIVPAPRAPSVN